MGPDLTKLQRKVEDELKIEGELRNMEKDDSYLLGLIFILQMYMILIHANNFGKLFHIVWCRDIIIHFINVLNPSTFISLFLFASVLSAVCTTG